MVNKELLKENQFFFHLNTVFLSLGCNKGIREENLEKALFILQESGILIEKASSYYRTSPWGNHNQEWFMNMAIQVTTDLDAEELLDLCQQVELTVGREKVEKWGPRKIDIDILYFNKEVLSTERLEVPHPYLYDRLFVLLPLAEIAPEWMDPSTHLSISELLSRCTDDGWIEKLEVNRDFI